MKSFEDINVLIKIKLFCEKKNFFFGKSFCLKKKNLENFFLKKKACYLKQKNFLKTKTFLRKILKKNFFTSGI